jgi:hypothetical protein
VAGVSWIDRFHVDVRRADARVSRHGRMRADASGFVTGTAWLVDGGVTITRT